MSNIDTGVPVYGVPTTQSVRDNFTVAKTEIEDLQSQITAIAPKANGAVQRAGDTMTGLLLLSGAPLDPLGAATKAYVDGAVSGSAAFLPITGGTMTGPLTLSGAPTVNLHAATKAYVDTGPAQNNAGRNRLHNSVFRINQRGYTSGTALAAAAYAHDRWKAGSGGCTYTFTQTQPATTITITAGSLQQIIEALNVEGGSYVLSWTGTAQGRVNAGTYAASPVTVAGLAANTAITVEFNAGTLGLVQFEVGTTATPYERQQYGDDLARCQRFYSAIVFNSGGYASAATSTAYVTIGMPTTMRTAPTVTYAGLAYTNASGLTLFAGQANNVTSTLTVTAVGAWNVGGIVALTADL